MFILEKVESAFRNLISSSLDDTSVGHETGMDYQAKDAPCVISFAENANEDVPNLGIWHVNTTIGLVCKLDGNDLSGSFVYRNGLVNKLTQIIFNNNLTSNLTSASSGSLSVLGITSGEPSNRIEGDCWVGTYPFDVVASV